MRVPEDALWKSGTCPKCRRPIRITLDNTRPTPEDVEPDSFVADKTQMQPKHEAPTPPAKPTPSPFEESGESPNQQPERAPLQEDVCPRCGRPFRGDWDRVQTDAGVLCHICANLAGASTKPAAEEPATLAAYPDMAGKNIEYETWHEPGWRPPQEKPPEKSGRWTLNRKALAEKFRQYPAQCIFAGVAIMLMLGILLFWPSGGRESREIAPESAKELSHGAYYFVSTVDLLFGLFMRGLTIYLTLHFTQKLPNDTFGKNAVAVGILALPVWGLGFVPGIGWALASLAMLYIWVSVFDFSLSDLLVWLLVAFIMGMLGWRLGALLMGGLGLILT